MLPRLSLENLFYELIRISIEKAESLSRNPSEREWKALFEISQKQAVPGIAFIALEKLGNSGVKLPQNLLFEWISLSEQIKAKNELLNKRCREITRIFLDAGLESCILKGQGNAMMYPVIGSRMPGDIDILVLGERKEITKFVKDRCPNAIEQYHHIDFPVFNDTVVEVHYTPGALFIPKYNQRFQQWCTAQEETVCRYDETLGFRVPYTEFNAVHQMVHIMNHFFVEGIGLRHFIDYYYVMQKCHEEGTDIAGIRDKFRHFGLEKFARGVMWIEQHCLGLDDSMLIIEPSEKVGKLILKEMEEGGNFGHYDKRYAIRKKGMLARGIADSYRLMQLATVFPSESFWKILHKIENQKWKIKG